MKNSRPYSNLRLTLHVIAPSSIGILGCVATGLLIVAVHILLLSLNYGTILPSIFSGDFAASYTNHIVQPLETLFHNATYGRFLAIFLWGTIGFIFYLVVAALGTFLNRLREAEDDVQTVDGTHYFHPLRRHFMLSVLWRIGVGIIAVSLLVAGQQVFKRLFAVDDRLFTGQFVRTDIYDIAYAILVWALIAHISVILLRLYLLKTRLFGEILR